MGGGPRADQDAKLGVGGVGTKLVTAYDQPALGGVYKLSAQREPGGEWQYKIKLSEQTAKVSVPGVLQVRRYRTPGGEFAGDAIYDEPTGIDPTPTIVDPMDVTRRKTFQPGLSYEELLVPVFRGGKLVYGAPPLDDARQRLQFQLAGFHGGVKRFVNPHQYPVGLEQRLHELRMDLILKARGHSPAAAATRGPVKG
jgi:nicotinate phosphoribosyltransferase